MRKESAKHAAYRRELDKARDQVLMRSHGVCERCGERPVRVIHHILRRSQGGTNDLDNLAGLCDPPCHQEVHANPAQSYIDGWLRRGTSGVYNGDDVRTDLPLANDETDEAIKAIWEAADEEVDRANQLFDWIQGERP